MKKIYFLFSLFVAILLSLPVNAQFFARADVMTPHYYPGEVYFMDGHHEAYDEVELPRVGKSKLGVKKNKDDKKRIDINAEDILGIKIWHELFPDNVHVLYYVHAKKAMSNNDHQWGSPIAGSAWGILFQCEMNYKIDEKTGDLDFVKFVGGSGPDTPTLYFLKRAGQDIADLLFYNGGFLSRKKAAELFKENTRIYEGIKSGKLKPSDIQYILDEMAGGRPAEFPVKVQMDSVQNGTIGDDE